MIISEAIKPTLCRRVGGVVHYGKTPAAPVGSGSLFEAFGDPDLDDRLARHAEKYGEANLFQGAFSEGAA